MAPVTEAEKKLIREEVEREFPNDQTMQEVHFARYLRLKELEDLPLRERLRQYVRPMLQPASKAV